MQLDLRQSAGGKEMSSQIKPAGVVKGGRRASNRMSMESGGSGADLGQMSNANQVTPPQPPAKAPHNMTASERVEFELSRESDSVLQTCTACGIQVPKDR